MAAASVPTPTGARAPCGFTQVTLAQFLEKADKGELKFDRFFFTTTPPRHLSHMQIHDDIPRCFKCGGTIDEHHVGSPDQAAAATALMMKYVSSQLIPIFSQTQAATVRNSLQRSNVARYYRNDNCECEVLRRFVADRPELKLQRELCSESVVAHILPRNYTCFSIINMLVDDQRNCIVLSRCLEKVHDHFGLALCRPSPSGACRDWQTSMRCGATGTQTCA